MAVRRYRGCKLRRKRHVGDVPVNDAPLERDEVIRMASADVSHLLDKYVEQAKRPLRRRKVHDARVRCWALWCAGRTPTYIAGVMGISIMAVNKHIKAFRDNLEEGLNAIPVVAGAELVLHYQNVYHEAIEAWHRSCRDRVRNRMRRVERTTTGGEDGPQTTNETNTEISREAQAGDARFLERAQAALDRIAVLQGQIVPGSLTQPRQVQNLTAEEQAPAEVIQVYIPHNGRDELQQEPVAPPEIEQRE